MSESANINKQLTREQIEEAIRYLPFWKRWRFLIRLRRGGITAELANDVADALERDADRLERDADRLERGAERAERLADRLERGARLAERRAELHHRIAELRRQRARNQITEDEYHRALELAKQELQELKRAK
jgi:hypothetical protein